MTIRREQRNVERSPEEKARLDALRAKYERERPGPDQLAASGQYEEPVQAGAYWEVRRVMVELKAERERQGLTITQLAERCSLDKGAISKLETGRQINPTIDTLTRIAAGLGLTLGITLRQATLPTTEDRPREQHRAKQSSTNETALKEDVQPTTSVGARSWSACEAQKFVNWLVAFQPKDPSELAEALKMQSDQRMAVMIAAVERLFGPLAAEATTAARETSRGPLSGSGHLSFLHDVPCGRL